MEVFTKDSTYIVANRQQVYKREGLGGIIEVGKFVGLFQRMPVGGAVPPKQENDLPLRLWYSTSDGTLHRTSPIVVINP